MPPTPGIKSPLASKAEVAPRFLEVHITALERGELSPDKFQTFGLENEGSNSASASAQREPAAQPDTHQARTGYVDGH